MEKPQRVTPEVFQTTLNLNYYIRMAIEVREPETLRFDASITFWFNSNFILLSTVLKLIALPFSPKPFLSVISKVPLPFTLSFTAANSALLVLSIYTTWQSVTSAAVLNFLITYVFDPRGLPPYHALSVLYTSAFP